MTKEQLVFIIGLCLAITPFIGIPLAWKKGVILICALAVVYLGYTLQRKHDMETTTDSYEEHKHDTSPHEQITNISTEEQSHTDKYER